MPNTIKYGTEIENNTLKKGDFVIGVNDVDYGPTNETGYHNTITPPSGGYVVYKNRGDNQRSIYVAESDEELVLLKDDFGATGTTANDVLVWAAQQDDVLIINNPLDNIVTDGLVLYLDAGFTCSYPKTDNTWYDLSGNGNDGTLINGPTFSDGSLVFDGSDDTVTTPLNLSSLPALSNFTMSCWVKITSIPSANKEGVLFGAAYYSGVAIYWKVNSSGTQFNLYGFIRGNDGYKLTTGFNFSLNTFYYASIVNDHTNGRFKFFIDGNLIQDRDGPTQEYNSGLASTAGNIGISKNQIDGGGEKIYSFFNGIVSNAKIYNRALSATEVLQNYNATKSRFGL